MHMTSAPTAALFAALMIVRVHGAIESTPDYLIDPSPYAAKVTVTAERAVLENGLVRREIKLAPAPGTISIKNLRTGEEFVRGPSPEARVTVNGTSYPVGGLTGQRIYNYLRPEWIDALKAVPGAYVFQGSEEGAIEARFPCQLRREWMGRDLPWPPKGRHLKMRYAPPKADLPFVTVHYEIYDGLPLLGKWLTIENRSDCAAEIDTFVVDEVRYVEPGKFCNSEDGTLQRKFLLLSDLHVGQDNSTPERGPGFCFCTEPDYTSQYAYRSNDPWTFKVTPALAPHLRLPAGESLESHRGWLLLFDSYDRERRGLAIRRTYRTLAPWTDENPLIFHLTSRPSAKNVREGIRQCAETGFETLLMSFGSGFNLESKDPAYRATFKGYADEARAKGIALGGYSLTSSRNAGNRADNVVNPKPRFDRGPCLGSRWGRDYLDTLASFMAEAGFGIFENDGPYPGDTCAATNHPYHRGLADSMWVQWRAQSDLYKFCRSRGIYVNQPDSYFFSGGNKTCMGYKEVNWSLPRELQPLIERQNIYDGSWTQSTSMGWMFVPLSVYHGGGSAATVEPLDRHRDHYDLRFADTLGAGVQACWRGPRLFDTPATLALVRKWTKFYKDHRRVLTGDLIHLRRADGRDWDGWINVDPQADEKALAFIFNPLTQPIEREVELPLYYAGLKGAAALSVNGAEPAKITLDAFCRAKVKLTLPAEGYVWILAK